MNLGELDAVVGRDRWPDEPDPSEAFKNLGVSMGVIKNSYIQAFHNFGRRFGYMSSLTQRDCKLTE